jgi:hypothetical protein
VSDQSIDVHGRFQSSSIDDAKNGGPKRQSQVQAMGGGSHLQASHNYLAGSGNSYPNQNQNAPSSGPDAGMMSQHNNFGGQKNN